MRYDPPFHRGSGLRPALVAIALLLVFPLIFTDSYSRHLLILVLVYAIVAASWDLSLGFGGLVNFAHVALFALGVYSYGILAKTLGLSPWLAIAAGGVVATLFAAAMALPILRLDGIYVILVTIAFSQLLYQVIVSQSDITGGTSGMVTLPALKLGSYSFVRNGRIGYYYTALGLFLLSIAGLYLITRSALGRAIVALRDNKYYAIARGVSEAKVRLLALAASAFFAGIAGAFYGSYVRVASPDAFGLGQLTLILSILLVGGAGTLWGPVVGAFAITLLSEAIADYGSWRNIAIGALIILILVFYPGGLWAAVDELRELADALRTEALARLRRRTGRRARERLLGAREHLIVTSHGRIAVADSGGDGPALLFIHGNSACKEAFKNQFAAFRSGYRLLAFDLPGHGASGNAEPELTYNIPAYAAIAEEVLRAFGISELAVFGWSLGGYVAMELAARGTVRVAALAISGTSPIAVVPEDFAAGYNPHSHLILAGKQYFSKTEARNYAGSATAPLSPESAFLHRNLARTDGRARLYMMSRIGITDWPRQMRTVQEGKLPFAILNGSDDPFLNHDYIRRLRFVGLWTGRPHDIPGGKHAPFFNKPEEFNAAFARFLNEAGFPAASPAARDAARKG